MIHPEVVVKGSFSHFVSLVFWGFGDSVQFYYALQLSHKPTLHDYKNSKAGHFSRFYIRGDSLVDASMHAE